ncbi:uncharacterized protein LY89DRAFT_99574 [Mollisia scopiformis]|uniref:Uncharacterized protein n=1 Tax=Mollisia scopiformis TaxID=149040 RepID=A0A194X6Z2_MOLSC|nr:uncharacterized protein LY89DRAFT_99574 [Mollisia scopiformis]KUJ15946.1 hypothetical protein LY89DRAFT_99574 [Mollisia scopiformis]
MLPNPSLACQSTHNPLHYCLPAISNRTNSAFLLTLLALCRLRLFLLPRSNLVVNIYLPTDGTVHLNYRKLPKGLRIIETLLRFSQLTLRTEVLLYIHVEPPNGTQIFNRHFCQLISGAEKKAGAGVPVRCRTVRRLVSITSTSTPKIHHFAPDCSSHLISRTPLSLSSRYRHRYSTAAAAPGPISYCKAKEAAAAAASAILADGMRPALSFVFMM